MEPIDQMPDAILVSNKRKKHDQEGIKPGLPMLPSTALPTHSRA